MAPPDLGQLLNYIEKSILVTLAASKFAHFAILTMIFKGIELFISNHSNPVHHENTTV
jgi:hypothetical protein